MELYLRETRMLDYSNNIIQKLIETRSWKNLGEYRRLRALRMKNVT